MFIEEIKVGLMRVLGEMGPASAEASAGKDLGETEINLEHPGDFKNGDYSTNIAMFVSSKFYPEGIPRKGQVQNSKLSNPKEIAETIVAKWKGNGLPEFIEKVEVAGVGFINIWLKLESLGNNLKEILKNGDSFGKTEIFKNKTFLLEHTSPNTNKSLHVGHVRNNITGMAISRILEFNGAKVIKDCLFNDRGIHICKAMWGYLKDRSKIKDEKSKMNENWEELINYWFEHQSEWPSPEEHKPDKFVEGFYVKGANAEQEEKNKKEIQEMLLAWEEKDPKVRALWQKLNNWVYEGLNQTFLRLQSSYDHAWYESEFYLQAKEMVTEGLQKKILRKLPDGAILTDLEKMGLTDTVVQRADGTSMYFTQDLYLTKQKKQLFPAQGYFWVVGPEQQLHLQQVFAVCEQFGIGKREEFKHIWYGFVFLKGKGKISSREGKVVSADELMDEAKNRAEELVKEQSVSKEQKDEISEKVGLGAIKYSFLKLGRTQDIYFDWNESISLSGNSGPYLQYTYARTRSVLAKSSHPEAQPKDPDRVTDAQRDSSRAELLQNDTSNEEQVLLRTLYRFPEVVAEAAKVYGPNVVCSFLFELSQKFNSFYDKQRIIGNENESFRLLLTAAVGQVLKNGLNLLGIEALSKM